MIIIAEMEHIGVSVNKEELDSQSKDLSKRLKRLKKTYIKFLEENLTSVCPNNYKRFFMTSLSFQF